MRSNSSAWVAAGLVLAGSAGVGGHVAVGPPAYHPHIDPAKFVATVDNPYFPLVRGTVFTFVERQGRRVGDDVVTVTRSTKVVMGVTCVVVHDVSRSRGMITEETFDWYAQDERGNVWTFGEATKEFDAHGVVHTGGSWQAGVGGAEPGIVMWGAPTPGAPYRQEYLAGRAEDMGQVVAIGDSVTVPYGSFGGCVRTQEWSRLEPGRERRWYARGIGMIRSESTSRETSTLVSVTGP